MTLINSVASALRQLRPEDPPVTAVYRILHEGTNYHFVDTELSEGDDYWPRLDLAVPAVTIQGYVQGYETTMNDGSVYEGLPLEGSVLLHHVSAPLVTLPLAITRRVHFAGKLRITLSGYGSVSLLGPLRKATKLVKPQNILDD